MSYKKEIIKEINSFYFDSIEEFREAEARIADDSRFRKIFGRKDYAGNVRLLKKCKSIANSISFPEDDIPEEDVETWDIVRQCREAIRIFNRLCDSYISMQMTLEKKSRGEKVSYRDFNRTYNDTKARHNEMNEAIRELDIMYAEYVEDDEQEGSEYMTYDMIVGSDDKE